MAKQTKLANRKSSKAEETELDDDDETVNPKAKPTFADDEDDDGFELPMDDLDSFDDLSFDEDDDF